MPDDPRPRLSLRNLPRSTTSDEPDMPPLDHTTPAAAPLVEQLFPTDTDNEIHMLFGLADKRVATRWRTGYIRLPLAASKKLID
ncbi:hypothetical protein [Aureimonas sp. SK2]|uniref:hypothetical protein n=1 Tax=Aureimonas sp. SK2 TaxID=3015992 RepID=UPI0024452EA8|nr:hypothetical protein [Aureimonas sp. SK2]